MSPLLPPKIKQLLKLVPSLSPRIIDFSGWSSYLLDTFEDFRNTDLWLKRVQELSQGFTHQHIRIDSASKINNRELDPSYAKYVCFLFFYQIYHSQYCFVDFRSDHFSMRENCLTWQPSRFYHQFSNNFLQGIKKMYSGFYDCDDAQFKSGFFDLGLLNKSLSDAQKDKILNLFKNHFGPSLDQSMLFKLEEFETSFQNIFECLVELKVKVSIEFAFVGIYIASLYWCLEDIEEKIDVKEQFFKARAQNN